MSDIMRPLPFGELFNRIFSEYKKGSIFGIKKENFYRGEKNHSAKIFEESCSSVLGPAAGPHTQLAQNIIVSYLVGGRFMELKTVQIMDRLEIEKPCIDARDEGYNVEWSTEYTLLKARDEYYKAWIICHLLEALMNGGEFEKPSFLFNMSVGYNLEGIKNPRMQEFIDRMIDASSDSYYNSYLEKLDELLRTSDYVQGTDWEEAGEKLRGGLSSKISSRVATSATISTMHGCPPAEIEQIARYMLDVKKISIFVKLNPTLLGYDRVREILDNLGYKYIGLKRETFEHDLQYGDALVMIRRLIDVAKNDGLRFGVKLTNTLASVNDQGQLPGAEMYMSGRALFPIATNLAAMLSKEFNGQLPLSYSGGANIFTVADLFKAGIRPITLATDMLHPGGYNRLKQMNELLDGVDDAYWNVEDGRIDIDTISYIANEALSNKYINKAFRGTKPVKVDRQLPREDCYVAPCDVACPVNQDVAKYVAQVAEGDYKGAVETLYKYNALPNITCEICDHKCQYNCSRLDYEGKSISIRDIKKVAVQNGMDAYEAEVSKKELTGPRVAVVGAGPAGISAATFLSEAGFKAEVFEREAEAGGTVRYVIPDFRIAKEAIEADVEHAERLGATFHYNVPNERLSVQALKDAGYEYILYGIGAEKENKLQGHGDSSRTMDALSFLREYRKRPSNVFIGKHVVVVGAGNSAMDAARVAKRVNGVETVTVVYRRTVEEMPADKVEYEEALEEGIKFEFLACPAKQTEGNLECMRMVLGKKDSSGRRSPEATDERFNIPCDFIIAAIGEKVDSEALKEAGISTDEKGHPKFNKCTYESSVQGVYVLGDMATGASSVIRAVSTARKAVNDIIKKAYGQDAPVIPERVESVSCSGDLAVRRANVCTKVASFNDSDFAVKEGSRCMDCSTRCEKCVDVCPNRANAVIEFTDDKDAELFTKPHQVIHIDAYCNECGNCATFCPYVDGEPYHDKFTVFSREEDFRNSNNDGFYLHGDTLMVRENGNSIVTTYHKGQFDLNAKLSVKTKALISKIVKDYKYLIGPVGD